jgi:protein-S-isoprenylcysteine O-methyltransferase Ste14
MYVGVLIALAGDVVLFWTREMTLYAVIVALGFHLFVCLYEEPTLARRHPEDYPRYKSHVPRWLPRRTPWHDREN